MEKKKINLLITDLDDTIWDWLKMWHKSFEPYLTNIQKMSGVDLKSLKEDFKYLHQKYGTSEVSFAYQELKELDKSQKKKIARKRNNESIIHQYYKDKKENLAMYEGVLETLLEIKIRNTGIVGFTESNSFYTKYRIKTLGLDGIFDVIYTPDDHGLPPGVKRYYPKGHWESVFTRYNVLPRLTKKPNPAILLEIIKDMGGSLENTIYIGDKLDRDIFMANQANITSVYAKYGNRIESQAYDLLKEVTHWTKEDVNRESDLKKKMANVEIRPSYEISNFKEILKKFEFTELKNNIANEDKKNIIEIWKNIVDVQKHFNNIGIRIRTVTLSLFTFLISAVGFAIKENANLFIFNHLVPLGVLIGIVGVVSLFGFYFMDRHWYHRFLQGAVSQGQKIEKNINKIYPSIDLTTEIKKISPLRLKFPKLKIELHSGQKLDIFYLILIIVLLLASFSSSFEAGKNEILIQRRHVETHSVQVGNQNDVNKAPEKPGVVMIFDGNKKLLSIKETHNIRLFLLQNIQDVKKNQNFYYCVLNKNRKELEEFIKKYGIQLREK